MRRPLSLIPLCLLTLNTAEAVEANDTTATRMDEVTVTGTREKHSLAETPATVNAISGSEIHDSAPVHPSQIMGQIPGVWVNVTGGEGHQTAIRQPLTTNPVYLYLEDGIPTRSTGFFNHNALYEINVPQAAGIEVVKGPGTALYGSDAIGGVVNVMTRPAPLKPEADISADAGQYGWRRLLTSGGNTVGENGWRGDLNLTHTDGWRDATGYDRQSATLRWDRALGTDATVKTVVAVSNIDQQTAGSSTISEADYQNNPTINYTPISFREVKALRMSAAYEKESAGALLSVTPYFRSNDMGLLANWSLTYDPTVYDTNNKSFGVLTKYRLDFEPYRARLITGVDVDYSPGSHLENSINTTKSGSIYTAYTTGTTLYDYDVTFKEISPYVHGELSPTEHLRLTAGLRYDHLGYEYDNRLSDANIVIKPTNIAFNLTYRHPSDTSISYNHLSPKLGATYAFSPTVSGFAAYNHAFRVPSEGQLFRQGSALNTVDLKPVKADSYEIGMRHKAPDGMSLEASLYSLAKRDDILSYKDPVTGATQAVNAGKTLHRGVELGAGIPLPSSLRLDISASYAKHTYEDWVVSGTADYSGKEMETAPRVITNTRLSYAPAALNGGRVALEWVKLGRYWMDAANTNQYEGHDLLNLRVNYPASKDVEVFGSVNNLADKRYAESASYTTARGREFAPGMPRTLYAGVRYNWHE
jgi:outer membrane receptor protein involved in Fe transport